MSEPHPKLDNRDFKAVISELRQYAPFYTQDWNANNNEDSGVALAKIFSGFMSYVIDRLNKVPLRNYIEFLNVLGIRLSPGHEAQANVTFVLSEGVKHDVFVNSGTRLSAAETEKHPALIFETLENVSLSQARLTETISSVQSPFRDSIYQHTTDLLEKKPFPIFSGQNIQGHKLYLAHKDALAIRKNSKIVIDFSCTNAIALLRVLQSVEWDYNWKTDLDTGQETSSRLYQDSIGFYSDSEPERRSSLSISMSAPHAHNARLVLSFSKKGPVKFDKNAYEPSDNLTLSLLAGNILSPVVKLISSSDPAGIFIDMKTKDRTGSYIESVRLTSSEESSSEEGNYRIKTKEGDVLTAYYQYQPSIASVVNLINKPEMEESELLGIKSRWIRGSISSSEFARKRDLIESIKIERVRIRTESEFTNYTPDLLFYNDIPINNAGNSSDPILPFGSRPMPFDSFYLSSEDVFSKKGALVTVSCLCFPNKLIKNDPILSWEYWNGKGWTNLNYTFHEVEMPDFDRSIFNQSLDFICPGDMERGQVSGRESYWIRARLVSGDYGKEKLRPDTASPPNYQVSSSEIHEPRIYDLKLSYKQPSLDLQHCLTYNNLEYNQDVVKADGTIKLFNPFIGQEVEDGPALFFGFDKKLEKGPINVYLAMEELEIEAAEPSIGYYYYSSNGWKRLDVLDGTEDLVKSGYIRMLVPMDFVPHSIFGRSLYWIKAVDNRKKFFSNTEQEKISLPHFKAIYFNTIPCSNITRVENELLGSSSGEKNQSFKLSKAPVVSSNLDTKIWVKETKFITEDEKESLEKNGLIYEVKDETGKTAEIWTLWQEIQDIYTSGPSELRIDLDRATGEVGFGDGYHGKIPSQGLDNVQASYLAGGGITGNVQAGEINSIKSSIPFIESVINNEPAWGGMDIETLKQVMARGPQRIKHRGQAVTYEDFEWLIREEFPSISKVKCFPTTWTKGQFKPGHVLVVIAPHSDEDKPVPSYDLLKQVTQYLSRISSNVVSSKKQLKVVRPLFAKISVKAEIYVMEFDQAHVAESLALESLKRFLNPLEGGPDGTGWEFGRIPCVSDLYSLLENIQEIDHIDNFFMEVQTDLSPDSPDNHKKCVIELNDLDKVVDIEMAPYLLVYNGDHALTIRFSEEVS